MTFRIDATTDGRVINIVSMVDEYTRESLLRIAARSFTTDDAHEAIAGVIEERGESKALRCDNGP